MNSQATSASSAVTTALLNHPGARPIDLGLQYAAGQSPTGTLVATINHTIDALELRDQLRSLAGGQEVRRDNLRYVIPELMSVIAGRADFAQVAREISQSPLASFIFRSPEGDIDLPTYLRTAEEPYAVTTQVVSTGRSLDYKVNWEGRTYKDNFLAQLGIQFLRDGLATQQAAETLIWVGQQESLSLKGQKVVALGGMAELGLLEHLADASVLSLDMATPERLLTANKLPVRDISYVPGGANLLDINRIVETIVQWAGTEDEIIILAHGYKGGDAMESRLQYAQLIAIEEAAKRGVKIKMIFESNRKYLRTPLSCIKLFFFSLVNLVFFPLYINNLNKSMKGFVFKSV